MVADVLITFGCPGTEIGPYIVFKPLVKVVCHCEASWWCVDTLIEAGQ
jgi:hypothetical protein